MVGVRKRRVPPLELVTRSASQATESAQVRHSQCIPRLYLQRGKVQIRDVNFPPLNRWLWVAWGSGPLPVTSTLAEMYCAASRPLEDQCRPNLGWDCPRHPKQVVGTISCIRQCCLNGRSCIKTCTAKHQQRPAQIRTALRNEGIPGSSYVSIDAKLC